MAWSFCGSAARAACSSASASFNLTFCASRRPASKWSPACRYYNNRALLRFRCETRANNLEQHKALLSLLRQLRVQAGLRQTTRRVRSANRKHSSATTSPEHACWTYSNYARSARSLVSPSSTRPEIREAPSVVRGRKVDLLRSTMARLALGPCPARAPCKHRPFRSRIIIGHGRARLFSRIASFLSASHSRLRHLNRNMLDHKAKVWD